MPDDTEEPTGLSGAGVVPVHGHGVLRPWPKGTSGNPGGKGSAYHEARRICREATPEAARKAVELMASPDERVAMVAIQFVFDRAFGKVGPERPDEETREQSRPDFSRLSIEERRAFLKILSKLAGEPVRHEQNKDEDHGTD